MKKFLILCMVVGIGTGVNAQTTHVERDIITEQVIYSVSTLKQNSVKTLNSPVSNPDLLDANESDHNPLQYVQHQVDYISIASTLYDSVTIGIGDIEGFRNVEWILDVYPHTTFSVGEGDSECPKIIKIKS